MQLGQFRFHTRERRFPFMGKRSGRFSTCLFAAQIMLFAHLFYGQVGLTIDQAVHEALIRYPAVKVSTEQLSAAASAIELARTSYLPRADFLGQVSRATHNNVFGLVLPQTTLPVISGISGPVLGTNSLDSVWGSAVGTLVSWEPFDFGLRRAEVELAKSGEGLAGAQLEATKLQVAGAAADAFLTLLAAQQTAAAAQAGVDRAKAVDEVVETLVRSELRPGADASRARAELSLARIQLIRAEEAVKVAKAALAPLLGATPESITLDVGPLLDLPRESATTQVSAALHPFALVEKASVAQAKARQKALERSYFPRFTVQGTVYARGTGIQPDGTTGGLASGLGPDVQNWAFGMSVTFPAMDLFGIRAKRKIEFFNELAEEARYAKVIQDLNGQQEQAKAALEGALEVARNTPVQLDAARATMQQSDARYKAGLATIVEVAEAQRLLTQSEIDDSLARLGVWRARLALNIAQGNLDPFLSLARK